MTFINKCRYNGLINKQTHKRMAEKTSQHDYARLVNLAAKAASFSALFLLLLKLYAWFVTDASSILASATDSLLDLFTSTINLVMLRYALAPADDEHSFGHGKAESLAGLIQSAFVMGSAILLMITGVDRLITPVVISATQTGIVVSLISLAVTFALVALQKYVIIKTQSLAISADAMHYQSDVLLNLGVLAALFLADGIWPPADGVFTFIVGAYLLWGAISISKMSVQQLMDHQLPEEERQQIIEIALENPKALGIHDLRTRQSGQFKFIQLHLELADNLPLFEAHAIGERIEQRIKAVFAPCEVLIHHDPISAVSDDVESITKENQKD